MTAPVEHQPREHPVACRRCTARETWSHDAVCDVCRAEAEQEFRSAFADAVEQYGFAEAGEAVRAILAEMPEGGLVGVARPTRAQRAFNGADPSCPACGGLGRIANKDCICRRYR